MRACYVYTVCTHTHTHFKPSTTTTYTVYTPRFSSKICSMLLAFHMSVGVRKIQQLGHRKFMIQALHQAFISWCAYTKTCCRKSENLQEKQFLNNEQNKLITRYRSRFGRTKKEDAGIARLGNGGRSISPNSHLEWVSEIHKVQSCLLNVSKRQSISTIKCIPTILQPKHPRRLSGGSLCKVPANQTSYTFQIDMVERITIFDALNNQKFWSTVFVLSCNERCSSRRNPAATILEKISRTPTWCDSPDTGWCLTFFARHGGGCFKTIFRNLEVLPFFILKGGFRDIHNNIGFHF